MESAKAFKDELKGQVVCNNLGNSRAIHRFAQKRIVQWVAQHRPQADRTNARFYVSFTRLGAGHAVGARIHVQLGHELWSGAAYGENLTEALTQGLSRMIRSVAPTAPTSAPQPQVRPREVAL